MTDFVYLIPGFFGFSRLGQATYFRGVRQRLETELSEREVSAKIHVCGTLPCASLRRRAQVLLDEIEATGGATADRIHLVGHSMGGLDARLLATPTLKLRDGWNEGWIGPRIKSVVTLSSPHYGTPIASFFNTLYGRNLLYALTVLATQAGVRHAVYYVARMLSIPGRLEDLLGISDRAVSLVPHDVLEGLLPDETADLWSFLTRVGEDQGAIVQLSPEAMDLFNLAVVDRPGVRYVSFLSAAPPPRKALTSRRILDLTGPATFAIYALAHTLASRPRRNYPYPRPSEESLDLLRAKFSFGVDERTNDGIVPTLSQIWGEIGGAHCADHLDLVGQYRRVENGRHYRGWLRSGSDFGEPEFIRLWGEVAEVISVA
jgi:triacylglycerol esterase/lipase EstA (alpha/beta hydrolase family)